MHHTSAHDPATEPASETLLLRLREADEHALDLLLKRYWGPLVRYLTGWLGAADMAEDVAQRTFLRLWDRRAEWRAEGSVRALLFRVARNLAISEQRSVGARMRAASQFAVERTARGERPPSAGVENRELGAALERAVRALPSRRREVFLLRCVHDHAYREIADIMGISEQTVANQLSRALATLRDELGELLDEERW